MQVPVSLDAATIIEASPDALLVVAADMRIAFANRAADSMLGSDPGALVGTALTEIVPGWARERHAALVADYFAQPRARPFGSDYRMVARRRDGSELPIDIALQHLRLDGIVVVIAGLRDRSAHHAAELARIAAEKELRVSHAKLDSILQHAPGFIVEVSRDGDIRYINRTRATPMSDVVGNHWLSLLPDVERHRLDGILRRVLSGEGPQRFELELPNADGGERHFAVDVGPLTGAAGEEGRRAIEGAIVFASDVTEQRRAQVELNVARRLASVGALAAGVAHEINNPLSAVISNLSLAISDLEELGATGAGLGEVIEQLRDAAEGAERIRGVAGDLRMLARPPDDATRPVDAKAVFEGALRLARNELRHRARVVRDYQDTPPVAASEGRLGQVLLNLLVNAAQAIAEGRAENNEIRVATRLTTDGMVCLEVADTGPGMPEEVKKRLFTPFFTTKPAGLGTGLGLTICSQIVRGYGGRIEVHTEAGKGSAFRVVLPPSRIAERSVEQIAPRPPDSPARRGRVLVVDDETTLATAMRRILARAHDVVLASSAKEALTILDAGERFDVIFCDVMMPDMTGPELIEEMRTRYPEVVGKVVIITGGAFTERSRDFLDSTHHRVVEKPFHPRQILEIVDERLSSPEPSAGVNAPNDGRVT